jgi:hypothetical protein
MGAKFIGSGGQSSIFEELFSFFWEPCSRKKLLLHHDDMALPVRLQAVAPGIS